VLAAPEETVPTLALAAAALRVLLDRQRTAEATAARSGDPFSPWSATDSWQPNFSGTQDIMLRHGADALTLRAAAEGEGRWRLDMPDGAHALSGDDDGILLRVNFDGIQRCINVMAGLDPAIHGFLRAPKTWMPGSSPGMTGLGWGEPDSSTEYRTLAVFISGRPYVFQLVDPLAPPRAEAAGGGKISAPIPGYVRKLLVEPGDAVKRGQPLIVLEAMKMELTLTAPADGTIEDVRAKVGEMVEEGRELILLAPDGA
jgi:3-methylcrotonyl-CoA carboxylase alpha subunit